VNWADDGPTNLANLTPLCHLHHRQDHDGQWRIPQPRSRRVTSDPATSVRRSAPGIPCTVRPVIGLTAYIEPARWGMWELVATLLPHRYVDHLTAAGGRPVLLPPDPADDAGDVIDRLDGLLLTGGADIDPARYGAEPHPRTVGLRPHRDASELALLAAAMQRGVPVLGICRGMQLMAVASGGTLHQHLPEIVGHDGHLPATGTFGEHAVDMAPTSRLAEILEQRVTVRSHHHQGVASTGSATATGWSDDGSVEALEVAGQAFSVGVLWHPEAGDDPRLFAALVRAARRA
jgi:putative glutamine amidotransferase